MLKNQKARCRVDSVNEKTNLVTLQMEFSGYSFSVPMQLPYLSHQAGRTGVQAGMHVIPKKNDVVEVSWDGNGSPSISGFYAPFHPAGKQVYKRPSGFELGSIALSSDANTFLAKGHFSETDKSIFMSQFRAGRGETKATSTTSKATLSDGTQGAFFSPVREDGETHELTVGGDVEFSDEATFSVASDLIALFPSDIDTIAISEDTALPPPEIELNTVLPALIYSDTPDTVQLKIYGRNFPLFLKTGETLHNGLLSVKAVGPSGKQFVLQVIAVTTSLITVSFQVSENAEDPAKLSPNVYSVKVSRADESYSLVLGRAFTVRTFVPATLETTYFDSRDRVQFVLPDKISTELKDTWLVFTFREGITDTVLLWDGRPLTSSKKEYWTAPSFTFRDLTRLPVQNHLIVGRKVLKDVFGKESQMGLYAATHEDHKVEIGVSALNNSRFKSISAVQAKQDPSLVPSTPSFKLVAYAANRKTTKAHIQKLTDSQKNTGPILYLDDPKGLKTNRGIAIRDWDPGTSFEFLITTSEDVKKLGSNPQVPELLSITPNSTVAETRLPRTLFIVRGRGMGSGTGLGFVQATRYLPDGTEILLGVFNSQNQYPSDTTLRAGLRFSTQLDWADSGPLGVTIPPGGPSWVGGTSKLIRASDRVFGLELSLEALPEEYLGTYILMFTYDTRGDVAGRVAEVITEDLYRTRPKLRLTAAVKSNLEKTTPEGAQASARESNVNLPGFSYLHEEVGSISVEDFAVVNPSVYTFDVDNKGNAFFQSAGQFIVNSSAIGDSPKVGSSLEATQAAPILMVTEKDATFGTVNGTVWFGAYGLPGNMLLNNNGVFAAAHDAAAAYLGRKSPEISVGAEFRRDQQVRVGPLLFPSMVTDDPDRQRGDLSNFGYGATYKAQISFRIRQFGSAVAAAEQPSGTGPTGSPTVTGVTPSYGAPGIANTIRVIGSGFTNASKVELVNGATRVVLSSVTIVSDQVLHAVVPVISTQKEFIVIVTNTFGANVQGATYVVSSSEDWAYYRGDLNLLFVPKVPTSPGETAGAGTKEDPFRGVLVIPVL